MPFLAFLPILVVAVLLVGLKWPASRAMPVSYLTAAVLAAMGGPVVLALLFQLEWLGDSIFP